jgi:hypothetical protein
MSIKKVKPNKNSGFVQGYYTPENPTKYIGKSPIIFRSSWERKFMIWCDRNTKVIYWSSEPIEIKYFWRLDGRQHKYSPDFYIRVAQEDGTYKEILIEIKPKGQLTKPEPPAKNSQKALANYKYIVEQYTKNLDKYIAANEYCKGRNWKFQILTEKTINGLH